MQPIKDQINCMSWLQKYYLDSTKEIATCQNIECFLEVKSCSFPKNHASLFRLKIN